MEITLRVTLYVTRAWRVAPRLTVRGSRRVTRTGAKNRCCIRLVACSQQHTISPPCLPALRRPDIRARLLGPRYSGPDGLYSPLGPSHLCSCGRVLRLSLAHPFPELCCPTVAFFFFYRYCSGSLFRWRSSSLSLFIRRHADDVIQYSTSTYMYLSTALSVSQS